MKDISSTQKSDNLGTLVFVGVMLCLFLVIAINAIKEAQQLNQALDLVKSLQPQSIQELKISPRTSDVGGGTVSFPSRDPLVEDLVRALVDIRKYRGSPKGIMSLDHAWFMEIVTTDGRIIQMGCHLPAGKEHIIHGRFAHLPNGTFQSETLFQWFQQYSPEWLGGERLREGVSLERPQ